MTFTPPLKPVVTASTQRMKNMQRMVFAFLFVKTVQCSTNCRAAAITGSAHGMESKVVRRRTLLHPEKRGRSDASHQIKAETENILCLRRNPFHPIQRRRPRFSPNLAAGGDQRRFYWKRLDEDFVSAGVRGDLRRGQSGSPP